jgi:hypothetical protein
MVFTKHLIIILNYSQDHGSNENTMVTHMINYSDSNDGKKFVKCLCGFPPIGCLLL